MTGQALAAIVDAHRSLHYLLIVVISMWSRLSVSACVAMMGRALSVVLENC